MTRQIQKKVKETTKDLVNCENETKWKAHLQTLVKQGQYLSLAVAEKTDFIWKFFMFNMKSGTLKFIVNASLDTLPTRANLDQWGKRTSDHCKLCLNISNPDIQGRRKGTKALTF